MSSNDDNNMWVLWMGLGLTMGFFAFTDIGKSILGEGERAAIKRVKEKGISLPSMPRWGLFDTAPRGASQSIYAKPPSSVMLSQEDAIQKGIQEFRKKVWNQCKNDAPLKPITDELSTYLKDNPDYALRNILNGCVGMKEDVKAGILAAGFTPNLGVSVVLPQGSSWLDLNSIDLNKVEVQFTEKTPTSRRVYGVPFPELIGHFAGKDPPTGRVVSG